MNTTPEHITALEHNQVFVFGSNKEGQHWGGAAKLAYSKFGAEWNKGEGHYGQSYAIPTMGRKSEIDVAVEIFISYARNKEYITFFVTEIGCGIAGFTTEEIAPLFADAKDVPNIYLPARFWNVINK